MSECPFCEITTGEGPATILYSDPHVMAIRPLGPFVPGHMLFIPREHATDLSDRSVLRAFEAACRWVSHSRQQVNILVSLGPEATQTVEHVHVHVLPRSPLDGTPPDWPWQREGR